MSTVKVSNHDFKQLKRFQEIYDSDPLIKALVDAWNTKNDETKELRAELQEVREALRDVLEKLEPIRSGYYAASQDEIDAWDNARAVLDSTHTR